MSTTLFNAFGEKFTMTIKNTQANAVKLALTQGIFTQTCDPDGIQVAMENAGFDVVPVYANSKNYGDDDSVTFKSANPKFTISQFQDFIQRYGMPVKQLHIRGNHEDILENDLEVVDYTPLDGSKVNSLGVSQLLSVFQQQGNRVVIDFENDPKMKYTLLWSTITMFMLGPGREVTFTFVF